MANSINRYNSIRLYFIPSPQPSSLSPIHGLRNIRSSMTQSPEGEGAMMQILLQRLI